MKRDRAPGPPGAAPARVLFLDHVSLLGGAQRSLLDLAGRLDRSRFVPLAALPLPGPLGQALEAAGVAVRHVPLRRLRRAGLPWTAPALAASWLRATLAVAALLRRERADLLHANSDTAALAGVLAARLAGVPAIWHCRDLARLGRAGRLAGRLAARVVCVSGAVEAHLAGQGIARGRTVVIPNGIDPDQYLPGQARPGLRRELGVPEGAPLIGMAAQLVPWKGQALFLDAAALLAARRPEAHVLVVGADLFHDHPGWLEELRGRAASAGLGGRATFTGWREDLPEILRCLDVVVLPSRREPFGRVILEAMALERPVVAVDEAGPKEIVEHGVDGLLARPAAADLALAMERLLADPGAAAALGRAGRTSVRARFHLTRTVESVQDLYAEVLGG